jgi:hypothetical protein
MDSNLEGKLAVVAGCNDCEARSVQESVPVPDGPLAELDRRQDDLMLAIDRLNDRIGSVLQQFGRWETRTVA